MRPPLFHRIVIMGLFQEELPENYEDRFFDWLNEHGGEWRILVQEYHFEDFDFENGEVVVSIAGEDAHSGEKRRAVIYSDFHGKVREVEPW